MTHKIIKTENYLLVVDDSEVNINQYVYCDLGYIEKVMDIIDGWIYHTNTLGKNPIKHYKKIIAHLPLNNSPVLEGVDLLPPIEDNIEQWAWDNPCLSRSDVYHLFEEVFKEKVFEGYYKISASKQVHQFNEKVRKLAKEKAEVVKEKYKYTEFDIIKAFEYGWNQRHYGRIDENELLKIQKRFIQSLQQPKMPVEFECEDEYVHDDTVPYPKTLGTHPKTVVNPQGQTVLVGKYIY